MNHHDDFSNSCDVIIRECLNQLDNVKPLDIKYPEPPYTPFSERSLISFKENTDKQKAVATKRIPWQQSEADRLTELKTMHQNYSFIEIASLLNQEFHTNRDSKQVQQRWCRVQDPKIQKGSWTPQEDAQLRRLSEKFNGSVRKIRRQMATRTVVQIRSRMDFLNIPRTTGKDQDSTQSAYSH